MKKFVLKHNLLPASVKRFYDISAEPLFACKKKNFVNHLFEKNEYVCRKWTRKNTVKCSLIVLPVLVAAILTGGICASVNEKSDIFSKKGKDIKKSFLQNDTVNKNFLLVVNAKTPIPDDYEPDLTHYMQIECDKKIVKNLDEMLTTAKRLGYNFMVSKGFVCKNDVQKNYEEKLNQLLNENFTKVRAEATAEKLVSSPGKSEYQTGLLVDICIPNMSTSEFIASDAYKWLTANCVNFGFIQRYPADKADKTLKNFSPFAFRFVGETNAKKMRSLSMCMEEYFRYFRANN
ncbi:serine-type D-Ala-D-Ala carboxypeptidase [Clostridium sp. CAG:557]|mgnify:FL=1|jgi:LAS superfamily LD-carboxypeptidase LdcB|nr:serine-type D-Ala-D-Ala carboxypeptidase [Clostridium sp. CAG:557]